MNGEQEAEPDTWLRRALQRRQDEVEGGDEKPGAWFNSALS